MQGKRDITSDAKCYDVITGMQGKTFFRAQPCYVTFERSWISDHFLREDHDLKIMQKRNM